MGPSAPVPADPQRHARLAFHWALAAIFLPIISVPVVWGLFWYAARRTRVMGWSLGILAVALVDTVLYASLLLAPERFEPPGSEEARPEQLETRFAIGVRADPASPDQIVVEEVASGSPADEAGVLAGDRVLEADGKTTRTIDQLVAVIQDARDDRPVRLRVLRDDQELTLEVLPAPWESVPPARRPGLFESSGGGIQEWSRSLHAYLRSLIPFGVVLVLIVAVSLRSPGFGGELWLIVVFAAAILTEPLFTLPDVIVNGGPSIGGWLIGVAAWCLVVWILAAAVLRRSQARLPVPHQAGSGGVMPTVLLGVLYGVTVGLRTSALLVLTLGPELEESISNPVGALAGSPLSPGGMISMFAVVALLVPIAEEFLFRGLLLGWLRPLAGDPVAVLLSAGLFALVHPHYGPGMVVILIYGVVLGWAHLRSGGLVAPIALHALLNGLLLIGAWLL